MYKEQILNIIIKMSTTLKDKEVKIKKARQCFSCYRKFPTGTIMHYWAGIYEGDFSSVYSCLTCQKIMDADSENEFPEGFVYDCLDKGETPEQYFRKIKAIKMKQKLWCCVGLNFRIARYDWESMSHSRADSKRRCVFNLSAPNWKHLEELGWECIKVEVIIKPIK